MEYNLAFDVVFHGVVRSRVVAGSLEEATEIGRARVLALQCLDGAGLDISDDPDTAITEFSCSYKIPMLFEIDGEMVASQS